MGSPTVKVIPAGSNQSLDLPVKLTILGETPPITATPPAPASLGPTVGLTVTAPGDAMVIQVQDWDAPPGCELLTGVFGKTQYLTPVQFTVTCTGTPGRIPIAIQLGAGSRTITVPMVPLAEAAPGLFTLDGTGIGAGAILNQDNSVNGPDHPASPGSVVQIFATGGTSSQRAQVTISGIDAQVTFAGPMGNGLLQINVVVPFSVTANAAAPLTLQLDKLFAPAGVTLKIR